MLNTDRPVDAFFLPLLVAHEAYPGHHTEHAWKEALLVDGDGYLEETIFLVGTPQAVVSEGIAMVALDMALGEEIGCGCRARLRRASASPTTQQTSRAVRELRDALSAMPVNAARLLHVDGRPRDEVIDYLQRWGLNTRERAASSVEFLVHPTWRAYTSCYASGLELCRRYVDGDVRRFRRLLTEQFTPGDLEADGHAR